MFSAEDKEFIEARGTALAAVERQIEDFKKGFPFLDLDRPATIGDGIIKLSDKQTDKLSDQYYTKVEGKELLKFVPASGAASRMFKELFEYLSTGKLNGGTEKFIAGLKKFAFYTELEDRLGDKGLSIDNFLQDENYQPIVETLLSEHGLHYGALPKGLLSFHSTGAEARTPIEEHLVEGAKYAVQNDHRVNLHFTTSPEHQEKFQKKIAEVKNRYEAEFGVSYQISFSQQKKSTDTIAVDLDNNPFYEEGKLLFRPAGHGALLENLNDLDADVIFIKNIDNVVPDHLKPDTITYKKALAGLLIDFQQRSFDWQQRIRSGEECLEEANQVLSTEFGLNINFENVQALGAYLSRPVRVCGIVENTGEPGGGPFWVKDEHGSSLQIAETAQIDLKNPQQATILQSSTHFNPVDLICGVRDFEGKKFDLLQYRDDNTGFITQKSRGGKEVKAMELPGLWNGAMANWITLFVEVPISTFNPVKTVNDLLKPNHQ